MPKETTPRNFVLQPDVPESCPENTEPGSCPYVTSLIELHESVSTLTRIIKGEDAVGVGLYAAFNKLSDNMSVLADSVEKLHVRMDKMESYQNNNLQITLERMEEKIRTVDESNIKRIDSINDKLASLETESHKNVINWIITKTTASTIVKAIGLVATGASITWLAMKIIGG